MLAFVLTNLVGLLRQVLITRAFGTGAELDAFYAAQRLPDILFMLVAGGALASAFIPTFTAFLEKEDRSGAWRLASAIINLVSLVLAFASLITWVFAPQVVANILAPDFPLDQQSLTVELLRILLLSPIIFGVSGLLMGILNAHQRFLLPALAPTMYWLGMILGVLFLVPSMGIYGLACGAVGGALLHLAVQLPGLLRLPQRRYFPIFGLADPAVREVGQLMAPRLLGVAVVQLNFLVNTIIASGQPQGSLTAITVAFQVMTMPQVVIAQAIAIAAFPTFAAQVARGELAEMRSSLASTLRGILLLSLPATLGLILLRFPVVELLFQRGEFDDQSTQLVAWALLWYTAGLVSHSVVEIASRAFYALHDTRTPVVVGASAMGLNVVFSLAFSALFMRIGWLPHGGLALANTLATTIEVFVLLVLMRRRLHGLDARYMLTGLFQAGLATLAMSIFLLLWLPFSANMPLWLQLGGGIALGGTVYAIGVIVLRVPEAQQLIEFAKQRLKLTAKS
ncbi:MAG: murein biosynthesis integral membrane protein MurJ [Chloroflexi bacterium]|nr:MAG: murein biosynthesis integral membrane protein MurJ [Chloroflexota bacterium]MBL1196764.1 murein biosynthesis integral membrane protein MurJ [Chloroflexota bacterium]